MEPRFVTFSSPEEVDELYNELVEHGILKEVASTIRGVGTGYTEEHRLKMIIVTLHGTLKLLAEQLNQQIKTN